jgi:MIP family channel proteins
MKTKVLRQSNGALEQPSPEPLEYAVTTRRGSAMDSRTRLYITELLGTFALVFVGAGTVCAYHLPNDPRPEVSGIALAEGFALAVLLTVSYHVSGGCLNPAITLMQWVFKRLDGARTLGLIVVQLLGAAAAGLVLRFTFTNEVLVSARLGTPYVKASLADSNPLGLPGLVSGIGVEFFLTCLVTLAIFATLMDSRGPKLGGVLAGLAQTSAILLGFHLTGGAANPARWFGPVVWQLTIPELQSQKPFADHAVYWIGPVLGALAGGLFYSTFILPPAKK